MKLNISKEDCIRLAKLEGDSEVGAGALSADPASELDVNRAIAEAVAAERERCARIAETAPSECMVMWDRPGGPPGNGVRRTTGIDIAKLIRDDR